MFYIYLPVGLSGVTKYYVHIIYDALAKAGYGHKEVCRLKDIPKHANVVTINDKYSTYAIWAKKPKRLITWFQGITPEEMDMIYKGRLERWPRIKIHELFEKIALRNGSLNLFVSEAMRDHYKRIYGNIGANHMIMPCFGNDIDPEAFTDERYKSPRFLYSGSMITWQCVDKMLLLFEKIKKQIPDATLNILTNEREDAQRILSEMNMTHIPLDFVEPDKLQQHIRQFKYGFIVRDDNEVNRVATPTKMSNYMGAGIIPVYSDVVVDYKTAITQRNPMVIPFNSDEECIDKIIEMESKEITGKQLFDHYSKTFNEYWNRQRYVDEMAALINKI